MLPAHVPLAVTTRSGVVESVHCGSAVLLNAAGAVVGAWGDITTPVLPRSAAKPLQLFAMMAAGLDLPEHLAVLVTASHSGQPRHVEGVLEILRRHGRGFEDLRNTPDWPLDPSLRHRALADQHAPVTWTHNCSGKHAGMVATCTVNGWPVPGYVDEDHPLQVAIRVGMDQLSEGAVAGLAVDGCGAPTPLMSLTALARAFVALATAPAGTPGGRIATSIRAHPALLGGDGREITQFLDAIPSIIAKDGAEAVWAAAMPDGRAVAVKIGDGGERAIPVVLARLLGEVGVSSAALDTFANRPVLGHGRPVGRVEAAF